jgi:uncharacterized protein (UPF0332 family)
MIQENEDRLNILNYRLEQSKNVIEEIAFHIERGFYVTAVNRIYYAMFYALSALALLYKFETSNHLQLIGWFNKTFIKDNLIAYKLCLARLKKFRVNFRRAMPCADI